jgi:diadenosine tetraphosphate (Ap4A) HIT family hydrolase
MKTLTKSVMKKAKLKNKERITKKEFNELLTILQKMHEELKEIKRLSKFA